MLLFLELDFHKHDIDVKFEFHDFEFQNSGRFAKHFANNGRTSIISTKSGIWLFWQLTSKKIYRGHLHLFSLYILFVNL